MTAMIACQSLVSPRAAPPLVTCRETHVTIMLPPETNLMKVKELGKEQEVGNMKKPEYVYY